MKPIMTTATGLLALTLALGGCASTNVSSFEAPGANPLPYWTYAWAPVDAWSTGDPRLDGNEFFQARVASAIDARLAALGFESSPASPDLRLHYHASLTQEITISGMECGDPADENYRPEVYDAGTLMIDLVDARTNRLVWRGWARDSFDGVIDDQPALERKVEDTVARILRRLPPRQTFR